MSGGGRLRAAARRRLRQIALGIQNPDVQSEDSILRARRESGHSLLDFTSWLPGGFQLERRLYQAGITQSPARFLALCGALSVPLKNRASPDVAAWTSASRCLSRLATGRQ